MVKLFRFFRPNMYLMGRTAHREIYKPLIYYRNLKLINENTGIIRFEAPLTFVNVATFCDKINDVLRGDASKLQSVKNVSLFGTVFRGVLLITST